MKYFLFLIPVIALFQPFSCHRTAGIQEGNGHEGVMSRGHSGEIVLTREQFETSGMAVEDPAPVIFHNEVSTTGYIVSSLSGRTMISTLISGRVSHIQHSVGDRVQKGTVLFTLEGEEIIEMQQGYAVAFQELQVLRSDYERLKTLSADRVVAVKDYLKAESDYKSKYAQVEGLKARLGLLHLDPLKVENGEIRSEIQIVSPLSGFVSRQDLVLGQYLEPHETPMEVMDPSQFRLSLLVYESAVSGLKAGQKILFSPPDRPQLRCQAELSHIGTSIDPIKRTIQCYGEILPEYLGLFIENTFVEAVIITCEREAMAIPENAVIREGESGFVLVLENDSNGQLTFRKLPVRTGVTLNGYTELLENGLTGILTKGAYNLSLPE